MLFVHSTFEYFVDCIYQRTDELDFTTVGLKNFIFLLFREQK